MIREEKNQSKLMRCVCERERERERERECERRTSIKVISGGEQMMIDDRRVDCQ